MSRPDEEGVGPSDQCPVGGAEPVVAHTRRAARLPTRLDQHPRMDVLGAVAVGLVDLDLEMVGTDGDQPPVDPHATPGGELDGDHAT